jgi:hypothetical protein
MATRAVLLLVYWITIGIDLWNIVKKVFPGILAPEDGPAIEVMGIDETETCRINHLVGISVGI